MTLLLAVLLNLAACGGLAVVCHAIHGGKFLRWQPMGSSVLTLLFFSLQAPDVALSELAVGTAATPLLFLAALASMRTNRERDKT